MTKQEIEAVKRYVKAFRALDIFLDLKNEDARKRGMEELKEAEAHLDSFAREEKKTILNP